MSILGKVLEILDTSMEVPQSYGWFHLLFFAASITLGILLCRHRRAGEERFTYQILLISGILVTALEIYKQINYTFSYDGAVIHTDYQWYSFPFQFCSTPMYASLLACVLRKGKVYDALCAYLATFALFAGLCVMFYPQQVFISTIGINVQSMICHGAMVTVGIYLLGSGYLQLAHRTILKAASVFAVCVILAAVMNEIAYRSGLTARETFNMFFISPYCEPSLPVYSLVQAVVPFPWCLFIYVAAFTTAAYIILLIAMLIRCIYAKWRRKSA